MMSRLCIAVWTLIFLVSGPALFSRTPPSSEAVSEPLVNNRLVGAFYARNNDQLFWMLQDDDHCNLRISLLQKIRDAAILGLPGTRYHEQQLSRFTDHIPVDIPELLAMDNLYTDAAITLSKDLYAGYNINYMVSYDGVSARFTAADDDYLIRSLSSICDSSGLRQFMDGLEPSTTTYTTLKYELIHHTEGNPLRQKQLRTSLNYYRWFMHLPLDRFIVVNIGSATLQYYRNDTVVLSMRIVAGAPDKRTPRFAAWCNEVTLYPYWNMPKSIAVSEWLPVLKRNPARLKFYEMELIDAHGRIIDPVTVNWHKVGAAHFPYRIRQQTGCLNPLGVIKFGLNSPYDVYLHDTNFPGVFLSSTRYRSHGCIRLEDPVSLANAVLPEPVDTAFLKACYKSQQPRVLPVASPVPVFIVYMTAEADSAGVHYYPDVYHLL